MRKQEEEETLFLVSALASSAHENGEYVFLYSPEKGRDVPRLWSYWVELAQTFTETHYPSFFVDDYIGLVDQLVKSTREHVEEKGYLPTFDEQVVICLSAVDQDREVGA